MRKHEAWLLMHSKHENLHTMQSAHYIFKSTQVYLRTAWLL